MIDEQDLPEDWTSAPLSEVVTVVTDKADPLSLPNANYIGLEHVEAHTMRLLGHGRGADVRSAKRAFHKGDVLYGRLRPYLNKVTRPAFDGICSTDFLVFGESNHLDRGYLANYMNQIAVADRAHHLSNGVELPRVDWRSLSQEHIAFPIDKSEQERIVQFIERGRSKQSNAIAHLASATLAIERFRRSVLKAAGSGRLTDDWRETHPHDPVQPGPPLTATASKHATNSPNTNNLLEIPNTWAWWSLESITERVIDYRGRTPPSEPTGIIPHVRTTQIKDGRIDWSTDRFITPETYDKYMTRGIPSQGDVLFTMEAPLGHVGVVDRDDPFSIAQRILLMRPGADLEGAFLALVLQSTPVQQAITFRATGSGVLGIAYKRLRSVVVPKPPIDEQREIIRRTNRLMKAADGIETRVHTAQRRLGRSAQAVLAKAFRGDLIETSDGR
jgi:type I restriction enzyme S subunit